MPVQLLPEILDGEFKVEVAWDNDFSEDPNTYAWYDITESVRFNPGLSTFFGRNDESSKANPAKLSLTLDNQGLLYGLGGVRQARRGLPIRVQIDPDGNSWTTLFIGNVVSHTPAWDEVGTQRIELEASGGLRRMEISDEPVIDTLRRALLDDDTVVSYWPLNDGRLSEALLPEIGSNAVLASGFDTQANIEGTPKDYIGVEMGTTGFRFPVDPYTDTTNSVVYAVMQLPESFSSFGSGSGPYDGTVVCRLIMDGGIASAEFRIRNDSFVQWTYYYHPNEVAEHGGFAGDDSGWGDWPGVVGDTLHNPGRFFFAAEQEGTKVWFRMYQLHPNGFWNSYSYDCVTVDVLRITAVEFFPNGGGDGTKISNVSVHYDVPSIDDHLDDPFDGYLGETVFARIQRLATENNVDLTIQDFDDGIASYNMGPQTDLSLNDLFDEAAATDDGVFYDGPANLIYRTRRYYETRAADLVLDASNLVFSPVFDDQSLRNRVTAKNADGSEAMVEDTDSQTIDGVVDGTVDVNIRYPSYLRDIAGWRLSYSSHYRIPTLSIDLRANPSLVGDVVGLLPGMRIDVENLNVLAGMYYDSLSFTIEGISHEYTPKSWVVDLNLSPYRGVGTIAEASGDTGDDSIRVIAGASVLTTDYSAGATSISVASTGYLWTTVSDDYPLVLDIGGIQVQATACSGSSSPQTLTIESLPTARSSGMAVDVWEPPGLGL